jgi:tetratricopeptide (TPR) repeat protein
LFAQIITNPAVFEKTDSQYNFGSVVLLRAPQMQTLHAYLYAHPVYRLRYMDAICCVYVKDRSLPVLTAYNPLVFYPQSKTAAVATRIFNPWYRAQNLDGMDEVLSAGEYYDDAGNSRLAALYAQQSVARGIDAYKGLELLGQIAYRAYTADTSITREQKADSATAYFNKAYKLNPEYVPVLIDLGVKAFNEQQYKGAITYLKKACTINPGNLKAQRNLAEVYKTVAITKSDKKMLDLAIDHFNNADHINPHNPDIMMNLGFLYFRAGDCNNAVQFLEQVVDYPGITELQRSRARECILKCK